mmetsp:Transcript_38261/g.66128  ORF Transcript_38261/g.66128 Transcript_38261/m.66128 type:complete len:555 (+) Transcript_38261:69-1733(+)
MAGVNAVLNENVEYMNDVSVGFDVVIVCTSNEFQADFWQTRLEGGRGTVMTANSVVLAVDEDWSDGGAGNALGTFYAYQKACRKAASFGHPADLLTSASSVAIYHTAGKGTRLAPLPGAENNNKPGVKLPALVNIGGELRPLTILESVIKQTGVYGPCRKGRLSVFWGDQVFIPSISPTYEPAHHADILVALGDMVSKQEWEDKGYDKYGLIAVNTSNQAAQVEKVSYDTATRLLASFGDIKSVGTSLGSFSVTKELLDVFLEGFSEELSTKTGKLDSDPHLWMPLSVGENEYVELMGQKDVGAEESRAHYKRVQKMMSSFDMGEKGLFGAVDVGGSACWWDYGQLKWYQKYCLRLRDSDDEAQLMRKFYDIPLGTQASSVGASVDTMSCVSKCNIASGCITGSVLMDVDAECVEADGAILVGVSAGGKVVAPKGAIVYNVTAPGDLILTEKDVQVGVFNTKGAMKLMRSASDVDGGKAWKKVVSGNEESFETIYKANLTTDVSLVETASRAKHDEIRVERKKKSLILGLPPLVVAGAAVALGAAILFAVMKRR